MHHRHTTSCMSRDSRHGGISPTAVRVSQSVAPRLTFSPCDSSIRFRSATGRGASGCKLYSPALHPRRHIMKRLVYRNPSNHYYHRGSANCAADSIGVTPTCAANLLRKRPKTSQPTLTTLLRPPPAAPPRPSPT